MQPADEGSGNANARLLSRAFACLLEGGYGNE